MGVVWATGFLSGVASLFPAETSAVPLPPHEMANRQTKTNIQGFIFIISAFQIFFQILFNFSFASIV
jgi:hypothetical protein